MRQVQASSELVKVGFSPKVVPPAYAEKGKPLIIAEAPGATEDKTGLVLHPEAEAGGLFTRLLARVGIERERFSLWNCVNQRPSHNELYDADGNPMSYTRAAIDYWKPYLHEFITEMQPPVIIGLGRTALEVLTGFTDIGTTRGYVHNASIALADNVPCECVIASGSADPECFLCGGEGITDGYDKRSLNIPTTCTYHPQFLNYGNRYLSGVFIRDVLAGLEIAEKGWRIPRLNVTPNPTVEQFEWFCRQYNSDRHILTYDIENPETRGKGEDEIENELSKGEISYVIDRMSFCFDGDIGGWSVPYREPFIQLCKNLLASVGVKRGHNCRLHDRPRLVSNGFQVRGREEDTLELWRHLHRTLPASVAYIAPFYLSISPWKHEAHTQPEWYSAMDAVCQHFIGEGIERDLRASGQWEMAQRHVVDVLALTEKMAENGLPYSKEKAREFELELLAKQRERTQRLQEIAPMEVRKVKKFKSLNPQLRKWFKEHGTQPKLWREHPVAELLDLYANRYQESHDGEWYRYWLMGDCWQKVYDFNPNSHLQKKALIRYFHHKLKTNRKTKKETSDDNTLKSLITTYIESDKPQDKVAVECYQLIRECVAISKVLGTYVRGWRPGSDGLIHSTPGIWGDMFRISWRDPNLAATVADKKEIQIASGFRKCIACSHDDVLIESDWRSQEAVILGYYAKDADYMRLAKLSLNAYMASHLLNRPADLSWSDNDLRAYLKEIRSDPRNVKIYDDAKHTIYLIQNGGTPYLISEVYELTKSRAKYLYDFYFDLFPKIRAFHKWILRTAHEKCKVWNEWNYRLPVWDAYTWVQTRYDKLRQLWVRYVTNPTTCIITAKERKSLDMILAARNGRPDSEAAIRSLCYDLGTEAKAALSFYPRDTGSAMLKDALLALEDEYQFVSKGYLRATAHDSIVAIAPYDQADYVGETIRQVQERPQPKLNGLVIEAETSYGRSWDKKGMRSKLSYLPRLEVEHVAVVDAARPVPA